MVQLKTVMISMARLHIPNEKCYLHLQRVTLVRVFDVMVEVHDLKASNNPWSRTDM